MKLWKGEPPNEAYYQEGSKKSATERCESRRSKSALLTHFAQCPELFAPMLALIESGKQTIASVMNQAGRALMELLLQLSAATVAGDKSPGRQRGEVLWHGSQGGQVCLLERRLKGSKPRVRTRGRAGRERAGCSGARGAGAKTPGPRDVGE